VRERGSPGSISAEDRLRFFDGTACEGEEPWICVCAAKDGEVADVGAERKARSLLYNLYFSATRCQILPSIQYQRLRGYQPISGFFLISSLPALRPSLAAAKDFSHALSSARTVSVWNCVDALSRLVRVVMDMVVGYVGGMLWD